LHSTAILKKLIQLGVRKYENSYKWSVCQ